jgi:hypothetical protein
LKRIFIFFSVLFCISYGYSQEKVIIGHWVLEKLQYQNGDSVVYENTSSQRWVIFNKNHTIASGIYPNQISTTGSWEYDKKNEQIDIYFDQNSIGEGLNCLLLPEKTVWQLIKLTRRKMIVGDKAQFHFRKVL